jgi:hypothetical protein
MTRTLEEAKQKWAAYLERTAPARAAYAELHKTALPCDPNGPVIGMYGEDLWQGERPYELDLAQ